MEGTHRVGTYPELGRGEHIRTVNRQGQVTSFYWASATRLDSVLVPPASHAKSFVMLYDISSCLDSMVIGGRSVGVTVTSGVLTQWRWPDGTYLSFGYSALKQITDVQDVRSGHAILAYGPEGLVDTSRVLYGSSDTATTTFTPWQSVGYASGSTGQTAGDPGPTTRSDVGPSLPSWGNPRRSVATSWRRPHAPIQRPHGDPPTGWDACLHDITVSMPDSKCSPHNLRRLYAWRRSMAERAATEIEAEQVWREYRPTDDS